ncbi:MAG: hypothetical protein IT353_18440 [Gemmatimonadaceae bacterium]|nr:hypothetical protein [Gemmatimonadaceae bacterium]
MPPVVDLLLFHISEAPSANNADLRPTLAPSGTVAGDLQFQSITAGTRHACGLMVTGEAYCWGNSTSGELGIGTSGGRFATPQRVTGGLNSVSLSLADHTCGATVNHNLYCWGGTFGGRLGNGQSAPGTVSTPTRVRQPAG